MRREPVIKRTTLVAGVAGFSGSHLVVHRLADVAKGTPFHNEDTEYKKSL
jgi:hypothetical protein